MPKFVFTFSSISKEDEKYLKELCRLDNSENDRDRKIADSYDIRVYDGTDDVFYRWGFMFITSTKNKMYYYEEKNLYVSSYDDAVVTVHEDDFERFKLEHQDLSRK